MSALFHCILWKLLCSYLERQHGIEKKIQINLIFNPHSQLCIHGITPSMSFQLWTLVSSSVRDSNDYLRTFMWLKWDNMLCNKERVSSAAVLWIKGYFSVITYSAMPYSALFLSILIDSGTVLFYARIVATNEISKALYNYHWHLLPDLVPEPPGSGWLNFSIYFSPYTAY